MTSYYLTRAALWFLMFLVLFGALYSLWGRERLKQKPWMQWLYKSKFGEWSERNLFSKSESVLWGRILQTVGYGCTAVLNFGDIDLTPVADLMPAWLTWLPRAMPVLVAVAGHIQVALREKTETPLAVIAAPPEVIAAPAVADAMRDLDLAKAKVTAALAAAQAGGPV